MPVTSMIQQRLIDASYSSFPKGDEGGASKMTRRQEHFHLDSVEVSAHSVAVDTLKLEITGKRRRGISSKGMSGKRDKDLPKVRRVRVNRKEAHHDLPRRGQHGSHKCGESRLHRRMCITRSYGREEILLMYQGYYVTLAKPKRGDLPRLSCTVEEHREHLALVFKCLRDEKLYCNRKKCIFGQKQVEYLGHIVSSDGVKANPSKITAMTEWAEPLPTRNLRELRGFLGLTGYYRKFVQGYGKIARVLTDLLKKDSFKWTAEATAVFRQLQRVMTQVPPWAEYWYRNTSFHSGNVVQPFKVLYGRDPPHLVSYDRGTAVTAEVDQYLWERDSSMLILRAQSQLAHIEAISPVFMANEKIKLTTTVLWSFRGVERIGCLYLPYDLVTESPLVPAEVCGSRLNGGRREVLIAWKDMPESKATWEGFEKCRAVSDFPP
ncbi:putative reverse transcriptase [Tanacetum coccineum]